MSQTVRWGLLGTSAIAEGVVGPAIRDSRNGRVVAVSGSETGRTARMAAAFGARAVLDGPRLVDALRNAAGLPLPARTIR